MLLRRLMGHLMRSMLIMVASSTRQQVASLASENTQGEVCAMLCPPWADLDVAHSTSIHAVQDGWACAGARTGQTTRIEHKLFFFQYLTSARTCAGRRACRACSS